MSFNKMPIGYGIIQTSIMRLKSLSLGAKAVYCLLTSYTGNKDYCFPSIKQMTEDLGLTKKTLYKYLNELKSNKLILVSRLYNDLRNNHKYEVLFLAENKPLSKKT